MVFVNPDKCPQDHRCPMLPKCPVGAISQEGMGLPVVDASKCIHCGFCISNCPLGAFFE